MTSDDAVSSTPAPGLRALIEGPPAYRPTSVWGPISALLVTAAACLAPVIPAIIAFSLAVVANVPQATLYDWSASISSIASPVGVAVIAFSQLVSLSIIWLAAGRGGVRQDTLRLAAPHPKWATAVAAGILLIAVTSALEFVIYNVLGLELFGDSKWLTEGLTSRTGWAVAIVAVVLAPLWEELTFRGFLLSALARSPLGFWPAAFISTALWTGLHWGYSYAGLLSVFVAGLMLSWLMRRLGSMRVVVVAHALANTFALVAAALFASG